MDKLYNDIVNILKEDSRFSTSTMAKMLNVEEAEIINAIKDLEASGVIVKYSAVINNEKTDGNLVEAFIEVKITPQKDMGFDQIANTIAKYPEVKSLYLMSGAYDLVVLVDGKNLREVSNFVHEKLAIMDNVTSTATHFILKCYKIEGIPLSGEMQEKRLPIQP